MRRDDTHTEVRREEVSLKELRHFFDRQDEAWDLLEDFTYVLYGGSRGPGKSYWLRWSLLSLLLAWGSEGLKGVTVGLFCETYRELQDRQVSKIKQEFPVWLGDIHTTQEQGFGFYLRPQYGSGVISLRNLDDPKKYQSAEFAAVAVDELTRTGYDTFTTLRGSKRWPGVERTFFLAASNPGGIGHAWVKRIFIDGDFPPELAKIKGEFAFLRALPEDNPYLADSYWLELDSLPEPLRSAWKEGDWSVFAGMAFPGWNPETHVVQPFTIPDHWPKWRAIDWGWAAPFCCLWFTKDPDIGRTFVYREVYDVRMTDRVQARTVRESTPEKNCVITYAPPELWARKSVADMVTSTADEYAVEGVPLTPAYNDRLAGKRKVDRLLMNLPDGLPGLQIFSTCTNLIRTLPQLPRDEARPEDVDPESEDHAYDTLKYGLTTEKDTVRRLEEVRDSVMAYGGRYTPGHRGRPSWWDDELF